MKKFKKIKLRVPRIPENAKIMSLMAIILICAAPALVSMLDDKAAVTYDTPIDGLVEATGFKVYVGSDALAEAKTLTYINDATTNTYTVALNTPATASTVGYYTFDAFDPSAIAEASKIIVTFDSTAITHVRFIFGGGWELMTNVVDAAGAPTTTWTYELTSVDKVRITSGIGFVGIRALFALGTAPATLSMEYETLGTSSFAYGEFIVGATGALLLICALFATPYFGLNGGYTGSRPKRRGA